MPDLILTYTEFLQFIKYIILEFIPSTALLYPPSLPMPGIVSTSIIFAFTYMCTHFLHCIHPPTPFPTTSHLLLKPRSYPRQDLFHHPVLWFSRRKKIEDKKKSMTFLLVLDKGSKTGSFLVIFPCMYIL
jgi:hypothetical protein